MIPPQLSQYRFVGVNIRGQYETCVVVSFDTEAGILLSAVGGFRTKTIIVHQRQKRVHRIFAPSELSVTKPDSPRIVSAVHITAQHPIHIAAALVECFPCVSVCSQLFEIGDRPIHAVPAVSPRAPSPARCPHSQIHIALIISRTVYLQAISTDRKHTVVAFIHIQSLIHIRQEPRHQQQVVFQHYCPIMFVYHFTYPPPLQRRQVLCSSLRRYSEET